MHFDWYINLHCKFKITFSFCFGKLFFTKFLRFSCVDLYCMIFLYDESQISTLLDPKVGNVGIFVLLKIEKKSYR